MSDKLTLADLIVTSVTQYRKATLADLVEVVESEGGTIEEVGEPGYYDHHGNDGAFVAPGRYLVLRLPDEEENPE